MRNLNLTPNADYRGCQVEVYHNPSKTWYPLVRTANKVVYYEDENEQVRRMPLTSLGEVNFINGVDNTPNPVVKSEQERQPERRYIDADKILLTNTNYEGQGIYVKHKDKGEFPLVRTAEKVIYYDEGGEVRRMTLAKFDGVVTGNSEEVVQEVQEEAEAESENTVSDFEVLDPMFDEMAWA